MNNVKGYRFVFIWLFIFGIGMGILEAIVVIYLREINCPGGFGFPLTEYKPKFFSIELIRELATIIMLISIGVLSGKNLLQRFCFFIFSFGVWDIFYYIGLKWLINWPPSFMTWDILFLIPVTWVGPVLAPVICSFVFIVFAIILVLMQDNGMIDKIKLSHWILFITGSAIIVIIFMWDFSKIIIDNGYLMNLGSITADNKFSTIISNYNPSYFNWILFFVGELFIISPLILICIKRKN